MKRLALTLVIITLAGILFFYPYKFSEIFQPGLGGEPVLGDSEERERFSFEQITYPIYMEPKKLASTTRPLEVNLIEVGVDSDGTLEAPEDWWVGGWYSHSAKPGEIGNVIINAHYDDNFGRPAAFYELKNFTVDDTLTVVDDLGRHYTYNVVEIFYVDIRDPDRLKVFEDNKEMSELTLITCSGVWLPGQGYNQRLVIKAILDDSALN